MYIVIPTVIIAIIIYIFFNSDAIDTRKHRSLINKGVNLVRKGNDDNAILAYTKALSIKEDAVTYYNRSVAYYNIGKHKEALKDLDKTIEMQSNNINALCNRGFIHYYMGNYKKAIQDFDNVIIVNPSFASAYYGRANSYLKINEIIKAKADYHKAASLGSEPAKIALKKL